LPLDKDRIATVRPRHIKGERDRRAIGERCEGAGTEGEQEGPGGAAGFNPVASFCADLAERSEEASSILGDRGTFGAEERGEGEGQGLVSRREEGAQAPQILGRGLDAGDQFGGSRGEAFTEGREVSDEEHARIDGGVTEEATGGAGGVFGANLETEVGGFLAFACLQESKGQGPLNGGGEGGLEGAIEDGRIGHDEHARGDWQRAQVAPGGPLRGRGDTLAGLFEG
jgi:hypothetical protein